MDNKLRNFYFELISLHKHSLKSNDILVISDQEFSRLVRSFEKLFDVHEDDYDNLDVEKLLESMDHGDDSEFFEEHFNSNTDSYNNDSLSTSESISESEIHSDVSSQAIDEVASNAFGVNSRESESLSTSENNSESELDSTSEYEDISDELAKGISDFDAVDIESVNSKTDDLSYQSASDASAKVLSEKNEDYGALSDDDLSDAMGGLDDDSNDITESEDNQADSFSNVGLTLEESDNYDPLNQMTE